MVSDYLSSCQLPLSTPRVKDSKLPSALADPAADAVSGQAKTVGLGWEDPPKKKQIDCHWNLLTAHEFHDTNMCMVLMSAAGRLHRRQARHVLKEKGG